MIFLIAPTYVLHLWQLFLCNFAVEEEDKVRNIIFIPSMVGFNLAIIGTIFNFLETCHPSIAFTGILWLYIVKYYVSDKIYAKIFTILQYHLGMSLRIATDMVVTPYSKFFLRYDPKDYPKRTPWWVELLKKCPNSVKDIWWIAKIITERDVPEPVKKTYDWPPKDDEFDKKWSKKNANRDERKSKKVEHSLI